MRTSENWRKLSRFIKAGPIKGFGKDLEITGNTLLSLDNFSEGNFKLD